MEGECYAFLMHVRVSSRESAVFGFRYLRGSASPLRTSMALLSDTSLVRLLGILTSYQCT